MKIKVSEGKSISISKKDIEELILGYLKEKKEITDDVSVDFSGTDNVSVFVGKIAVEDIPENELISKSIKQILKQKGYNTKNLKIEPVKTRRGK